MLSRGRTDASFPSSCSLWPSLAGRLLALPHLVTTQTANPLLSLCTSPPAEPSSLFSASDLPPQPAYLNPPRNCFASFSQPESLWPPPLDSTPTSLYNSRASFPRAQIWKGSNKNNLLWPPPSISLSTSALWTGASSTPDGATKSIVVFLPSLHSKLAALLFPLVFRRRTLLEEQRGVPPSLPTGMSRRSRCRVALLEPSVCPLRALPTRALPEPCQILAAQVRERPIEGPTNPYSTSVDRFPPLTSCFDYTPSESDIGSV